MKCYEWVQKLTASLSAVSESPEVEARALLMHVLNLDALGWVLGQKTSIESAQSAELETLLQRRLLNEPLQYILGYQCFYGRDFKVTPAVLIPRPETEILVEKVLHIAHSKTTEDDVKVLDMGAGSGAIGVSVALASGVGHVTAVDVSSAALEVAERNAKTLGAANKMSFVLSDYFSAVPQMRYDIIVSNPPYIEVGDAAGLKREVDGFEPHLALYGGADGLDAYRVIVPAARGYLKDGGFLLFEAGHNQSSEIAAMMRENAYIDVATFSDLNGIERFIVGRKG